MIDKIPTYEEFGNRYKKIIKTNKTEAEKQQKEEQNQKKKKKKPKTKNNIDTFA